MQLETEIGLEILSEVGRISNSTLNLEGILTRTIEIIKNKLRIDACGLYLYDEDDGDPRLKLKASSGLPEIKASKVNLPLGKGVTGWVAENKVPLALSQALKDPRFVYFPEIEEERFQGMLSVPMIYQEDCIGVINVHTIEIRDFNPMEITILKTISEQITGCIRNAVEFEKSHALLREQTLLYEISQAVQSAARLEHRLWILMTGITLGEGGGFNRALLLQLNEAKTTLHGIMGVGPDSAEDAGRIWTELEHRGQNEFHWVLQNADREAFKQTRFHQWVQSLEFPLQPNHNIFAESILQNESVLVTATRPHPLVPEGFCRALGVSEFAVVPLIAHDVPLGAILVDNRYNEHPITEPNLKLFARLANQASWVIENSRLFSKLLESNRELLSTKELLVHSEKLAAIGELSAEVAHEIKNPLVSIGGFARRLKDRLDTLCRQEDQAYELKSEAQYAGIIVQEVERLETLLKNLLSFSKPGELNRVPSSLVDLTEEVLHFFEAEFRQNPIEVIRDFEQSPKAVEVDPERVKQVLLNIVFNALQSMDQGGKLSITIFSTEKDHRPQAAIRIEDTGGGISQEIFENIFNPFFTTKNTGTGLGLSISRKIMESHGGSLSVHNHPNKGVEATLLFPLQKSGE